ncbi:MAG: phosphoribosyl transferase [Candidatus Latescibacteria bacterium]|nr:phosphoribosyl transferase [Candidatus Latescibacterota bacterium]
MDSKLMRFLDRSEAGRLLAERLAERPLPSPRVVAGIPRGGVLVASRVAERLGAPLAVAYARKVTPYPGSELAIGAVDEDGELLVATGTGPALGLTAEKLEEAKNRALAEIHRQRDRNPPASLRELAQGRAVVLVDDGLATGLTMQAAVGFARRHGASHVTVATPCASVSAARRFRRTANRFVSLVVDPDFVAVGIYYLRFPTVSDVEVAAAIAAALERRPAAGVETGKPGAGTASSVPTGAM